MRRAVIRDKDICLLVWFAHPRWANATHEWTSARWCDVMRPARNLMSNWSFARTCTHHTVRWVPAGLRHVVTRMRNHRVKLAPTKCNAISRIRLRISSRRAHRKKKTVLQMSSTPLALAYGNKVIIYGLLCPNDHNSLRWTSAMKLCSKRSTR